MKKIKFTVFTFLMSLCLLYATYGECSPSMQADFFKDYKCGDPWTANLELGYTYGQFIGMKKSYGELGLFFAPKHAKGIQHFIDARGYLIENGQGAASVGIGRRLWIADSCRVLGANIYYDYRRGNRGAFNRIGVGLEYLGECVDFRANGYFPLNHGVRKGKEHIFNAFIGPFFETCQEKEFAFLGFDFEIGRSLWSDCFFDVYGAIGPYFYHHSELDGIYGGYARLDLNLNDWLWLEARVSSDNMYHTNVQGTVNISFPLYRMFNCSSCQNSCKDILTQPVQRNNVIFTESCCSRTFNWDELIEEEDNVF